MNAIMTRSAKLVDGFGEKDMQEESIIKKSVEVEETESTPPKKVFVEEKKKEEPYVSPPPYTPQIPFLQMFAQVKRPNLGSLWSY